MYLTQADYGAKIIELFSEYSIEYMKNRCIGLTLKSKQGDASVKITIDTESKHVIKIENLK